MSTSSVLSRPASRSNSGSRSMRRDAPLVNAPIVEVSEDSSSDGTDHDADPVGNNINFTRRSITTNRKKRKARRNSTPSFTRRGGQTNQLRRSPPYKMQRSLSYHGYQNGVICSHDHPHHNELSLDGTSTSNDSTTIARGGVPCPFPWKLHEMLDYCCPQNDTNEPSPEPPLVTWNTTGTAFAVLDASRFVQAILPRYVQPWLSQASMKH